MPPTASVETIQDSISIARQPIFDDNLRLWGYELFCVGTEAGPPAGLVGNDTIACNVAASAYLGLQQIVERGKKIVVDFNEKGILGNMPYALPPLLAVVKIAEMKNPRPELVASLARLKSDGYLVAVAGFTGSPAAAPLHCLADILGVDITERRKDELASIMEAARAYPAMRMALRVAHSKWLDMYRDLGFGLFCGSFFKTPDEIKIRKLSSNEVARFQLLRMLEAEEPNFRKLAETIQADVSISFRLLSYLNSAAFGFPRKIKSISQAITILGWRKMKNWLRVVLLTDVNQRKEASDLVMLSAQRAKFLELIARDHDFWGFDPDSLHLLGLFSLIDAMLGIPMTEIVTHLPIENKIKAALCGDPNNEYQPLLQLSRDFEEARWADAETMIRQLNLDETKVRTAFKRSVDWGNELAALHA